MNNKTRITIGTFKIKATSPEFTLNLSEVIEEIKPMILSSPDSVKHTIEINFQPEHDYSKISYCDSIIAYKISITREMTTEEYQKAGDAPSRASKIEAINKCFDTSAWTGHRGK